MLNRILNLSILASLLFLMGCAKPNYQNEAFQVLQESSGASGKDVFDFSQSDIQVQIQWKNNPTEKNENELILKFLNKSNSSAIDLNYNLAVSLWMPSMGHGSSPVKIEKLDIGVYRVSRIYFIMPGEWDLRIQLKDNSTVVDQVVQKINL